MSMRPWREGRALHNPAFGRDVPNWWAWIPVYVGFAIATTVFEDAGSRLGVACGYVVALLLGVAWQVLNPRDLADRLTLIAAVVGVVGLVLLIPVDGDAALARHDTRHFVLIVPLIAGLVLAQHWLRYRDARRRTTAPEAVGDPD